jgi:aerotaxis receptor
MGKEIIFDKNMMIVSETDQEGIIKFANRDFCKIAGYEFDEIIGKPHNILRHKDMPKAAFEDLWSTIKAGKVWKGIVKNNTKNGDYYWVNATVFENKNESGEIRYISVRVKPTKEEIMNAIEFYKTIV